MMHGKQNVKVLCPGNIFRQTMAASGLYNNITFCQPRTTYSRWSSHKFLSASWAPRGGRGRDVARLLRKLILSLKRLETLFITSSEEHSTTCLHATCKLQPAHRVKENDRSVKNTLYILFLLTSLTCFFLFPTDSGYMFPVAPIHHRAPIREQIAGIM